MPVRFKNLASTNYRNHRKMIIVDGKIGFIGGLNIDERYLNNGKHNLYWRDTHLKIEGPAVNILQLVFSTDWRYVSKKLLPLAEACRIPEVFRYAENPADWSRLQGATKYRIYP